MDASLSPLGGWVPPSKFYCIASAAPYRKTVGLQELCFVELQLDKAKSCLIFFSSSGTSKHLSLLLFNQRWDYFNIILGRSFTAFLGHEFGNLDLN